MLLHQGSLADYLLAAKTLIDNATGIVEIAEALAMYGYDAARLGEGRALWAETDALFKKQALDGGIRSEASAQRDKAWASAKVSYMKALKVARVAFRGDAKAVSALRLKGPRRQSLAAWLDQAGTFYASVSADPRLAEGLARYGYTEGKLSAERAAVESVRRLNQAKIQGVGAAQASTAARDKKLRELDSWMGELRAIARVAFYESPQELEKLGIMARNGPRRAKRAKAPLSPIH